MFELTVLPMRALRSHSGHRDRRLKTPPSIVVSPRLRPTTSRQTDSLLDFNSTYFLYDYQPDALLLVFSVQRAPMPQEGVSMVSVTNRALHDDVANWAAKYVTVRNIGRHLGRNAMTAATEMLWRRRQGRDLALVAADHFATGGATVIDVGASWGLFTYHLARRVGKAGQVYSFEPHPANAPMLRKLATARRHVHFSPSAVSDSAGRAELLVPRQQTRLVTAQASLSHGFDGQGVDVETIEVHTVRLDDEIAPAVQVDFVKIDVEGHEMAVLRGGSSMFRRNRPSILIEIEQRHLSVPIDDVFGQLEDLGYQVFYVTETAFRPIADFNTERDQMSMVRSGEFHPFAMPQGYVHDFCAVRTPELLAGLPVASA
jgi:FkbM family methyltransferase